MQAQGTVVKHHEESNETTPEEVLKCYATILEIVIIIVIYISCNQSLYGVRVCGTRVQFLSKDKWNN